MFFLVESNEFWGISLEKGQMIVLWSTSFQENSYAPKFICWIHIHMNEFIWMNSYEYELKFIFFIRKCHSMLWHLCCVPDSFFSSVSPVNYPETQQDGSMPCFYPPESWAKQTDFLVNHPVPSVFCYGSISMTKMGSAPFCWGYLFCHVALTRTHQGG